MSSAKLIPHVRPMFLLIAAAFALAGCATNKPLPTVARVDLKRYAGRWFEIAHVRNSFQHDDERAVAEYTPLTASTLHVRNTATEPSGKTRSIEGMAEVVPESQGARLRVKFHGLAALAPLSKDGNYWIIALDQGYQGALVGTPNRKYLWILARSPRLSSVTVRSYVKLADRLGCATQDLVWDAHQPGAAR